MSDDVSGVIVVTTNDLPDYEITEVFGEAFGLIVRSRNLFGNFGASFRTVFGGEVRGYWQHYERGSRLWNGCPG